MRQKETLWRAPDSEEGPGNTSLGLPPHVELTGLTARSTGQSKAKRANTGRGGEARQGKARQGQARGEATGRRARLFHEQCQTVPR